MNKALATVIAVGAFIVSAMTAAHADAIDTFVNGELARQKTPGAALAIMHHGQLVRAQGYGFANLEHQVPVHPDTIFQSGSIGKQFTAAAVMLLAEDGTLRLDESIRTYFPDAPKTWQPITLRNMLNHTSGIPGDPNLDLRKDYTDDELLKLLYQLKPEFPAGSRWSYSNSAYATLGLLIRKVSGEFYGDVLKKRVFGPLDMQTARVISDREVIPNRAAGYEVNAEGTFNQDWVAPTGNSTADGSLYLTVLDYAKWDAALVAGKILKPESWAEVYKPAKLTSGKTFPYGFGWSLKKSSGQDVHQHGGAWQGFRTFFIRYLGEEVSVVVLTNSDAGRPEEIARGVAGLYNTKLALPPGAPIEDREPAVTERAKRLLTQLAAGAASSKDFPLLTAEAFKQYSEHSREKLKPLGALQEIRLFARNDLGDDRDYNYRARFENGLMSMGLTLDPSGRVSKLSLQSVEKWDSPVSP